MCHPYYSGTLNRCTFPTPAHARYRAVNTLLCLGSIGIARLLPPPYRVPATHCRRGCRYGALRFCATLRAAWRFAGVLLPTSGLVLDYYSCRFTATLPMVLDGRWTSGCMLPLTPTLDDTMCIPYSPLLPPAHTCPLPTFAARTTFRRLPRVRDGFWRDYFAAAFVTLPYAAMPPGSAFLLFGFPMTVIPCAHPPAHHRLTNTRRLPTPPGHTSHYPTA